MNLKVLFIILGYYGLFSVFLLLGSDIFNPSTGYTGGIEFNQSGEMTSTEISDGGLFTTGVNFGRFFGILLFGIGLPSSFPSWFTMIFTLWQIVITIISAGWLISSIWDG